MLRKQKESENELNETNKRKEKVSLKQKMQNYKSRINGRPQVSEKMFVGGGGTD